MSARELITEHLNLWTGAVTKKSSSGRGSNGKIELTGVKKLRELIVELALSGRLVEPEPDEESAHRLLSRIEAEKSRLAAQGLINKPKKLPEASDSQPYSLPPHWCWARLGSITNYGTSDKAEPNQVAENTWVLELEDIEKESSKLLSKVRYMERQFKSSKNRFERGDVLYGKLRPYLDKVLVADESGVCTTEIIPIRGYLGLLPEFLRLALKSPSFKRYANDSTHGMNLPRLGTDKARLAMIPLAPEQEQHHIVQKVDELMTLCDRLEQQTSDQLEAHETLVDTLLGTLTQSENATELANNWARLAAHFDTLFTTEQSIDNLKQTILQLAVMGRLVGQDAGDEPTAQLLERVSNEKQRLVKSKVLKRTKSLAPLDTSALPSIPESWSWVNLGDIISVMDAGWSPACPPRPAGPETWGVLKTTAVQVMKYQEFENKELPDNKAPKERYEVRSGDILITRAGPKNRVGISCVVKETRDKLMISDKIIRFHLIETGLSEEYICLCLNAGETYSYLEQAKSGMAESQMNISQDKLKAAPVPLCPANEQHRIVQKIDELMALCDQLKERLNQAGETQLELTITLTENALAPPSRKKNHTTKAKPDPEFLAHELLDKLNLDDYVIKVPVSKGRSSKGGPVTSLYMHLEVRGPQGEGGVEYLDLPPLLRKIDELATSYLGDELLTSGIGEVLGLAGNVFTHGAGTVLKASVVALKKLFGQLRRLDQIYALILMTFPQKDERSDAEISERLKNACKLTGLPSIDEHELSSRLNHLKSLGFVKRHKSMEGIWLLVRRYRRTDYF